MRSQHATSAGLGNRTVVKLGRVRTRVGGFHRDSRLIIAKSFPLPRAPYKAGTYGIRFEDAFSSPFRFLSKPPDLVPLWICAHSFSLFSSDYSDTDSQNASAQDYDDAVEATPTDDSSANSTRSPGEVEGVEGPRDGTTRRRGKSPRVVITHFYDRLPTYSPTSRDALQKTFPPQPASSQAAPVCGSSSQRTLLPQPISSQAPPASGSSSQPSSPRPQASAEGDLIPLSSDDVRNQPCLLTVTELEEVKSLLIGQVEFQTRRSLGNYPTATRALKNAVVKISADSYEYWIFRSPASVAAANLEPPDYSKPEKYVPKRAAPAIPPVSEAVNPGMVLERIFAPAPSGPKKTRPKAEAPSEENVVRKEVVPLKESLAAKDKELKEKVQALEGRVAQAEQEVEAAKREAAEMNEKMSDYTNLSGFLYRDKKEAEAFFRAFLHNKVGEDLAWRYGAWAFEKGRQAMQQEVQEALVESLNEEDLATITGIMPDPVPDPGVMPYDDPVPSSGVAAPGDAPMAGLWSYRPYLGVFSTLPWPMAGRGLLDLILWSSRPYLGLWQAVAFSALSWGLFDPTLAYGRPWSSRPHLGVFSTLSWPMASRGLFGLVMGSSRPCLGAFSALSWVGVLTSPTGPIGGRGLFDRNMISDYNAT
nr:serine/arginine repetitive matrix protein 2-like [Ipomoea batatas]